ncbi:MAG: DUF2599 domain-containing protein [Micrococcales bacterium]|nr:DUF2599 domain-containing protein [Micrococcales bacterium]
MATHYEVRATDLVQVIEPTRQTTYPVVADPWLGQWLVSSVKAVKVSQGTVYQVTPTLLGRTSNSLMYSTLYSDAVSRGMPNQQKYHDQLICHPLSEVARVKSTWNIDSWRPNVGMARTILAGCNP